MGNGRTALAAVAGLIAAAVGGDTARSARTTPPATHLIRDVAGSDMCVAALPQARGYGIVTRVRAARTSTGRAVIGWQEHRDDPTITGITSPLRGHIDPGTAVTVCVFTGMFTTPTALAIDGSAPRTPNTLTLLLLADGTIMLDSAGSPTDQHTDTDEWRHHPSPASRTGNR